MTQIAQDEQFRQIKLLMGRLDDLNQERRRLFTEWTTRKIEPGRFVAGMKANALATRDEAARLDGLLG